MEVERLILVYNNFARVIGVRDYLKMVSYMFLYLFLFDLCRIRIEFLLFCCITKDFFESAS